MEIVSIIIAALALIVSYLSFKKSNETSKSQVSLKEEQVRLQTGQESLQKAQVEMQMREMISIAKFRYADVAIQLSKDIQNQTLQSAVSAALEDVANAYDEACAKYIDNKIDKERFKKLYFKEIQNIVEDNNTKHYYASLQSNYNATRKVYKEWYIHEEE